MHSRSLTWSTNPTPTSADIATVLPGQVRTPTGTVHLHPLFHTAFHSAPLLECSPLDNPARTLRAPGRGSVGVQLEGARIRRREGPGCPPEPGRAGARASWRVRREGGTRATGRGACAAGGCGRFVRPHARTVTGRPQGRSQRRAEPPTPPGREPAGKGQGPLFRRRGARSLPVGTNAGSC